MTPPRYLIVNADDFGQSFGTTRGIIAAHERGIVTSASLMVRWPAAASAAAYSQAHPKLSLGLHVDLGEWIYRDGAWGPRYQVVTSNDATAVAGEVERQLATFRRLVGRDPSHVDSHQHVHLREPVRSVLIQLARQLAVPLRHLSPGIRYRGDFYGQDGKGYPLPEQIRVDALIGILATLPPGITELGCHPGEAEDLDSPYRHERAEEVKVLCDPRIRAARTTHGVELRSFADVAITPGGCASMPRLPPPS